MKQDTQKLMLPALVAFALAVVGTGCSHQASGGNALEQQRASVMGSPAPPDVQAQVAAQQAAQKAAIQAHQQSGQQAASQEQPAPK